MRTGLKALQSRQKRAIQFELPEYAQAKKHYASQSEYEKAAFGGPVERTIERRAFGEDIWETLKFGMASYELSGFAQVKAENTSFAEYDGKQVKELLQIDNLFNCPWFNAALCELLDAGCVIKTQRAEYKIGERIVKKGNALDGCFVSARSLKKAA